MFQTKFSAVSIQSRDQYILTLFLYNPYKVNNNKDCAEILGQNVRFQKVRFQNI
jgi:hypothetical protein